MRIDTGLGMMSFNGASTECSQPEGRTEWCTYMIGRGKILCFFFCIRFPLARFRKGRRKTRVERNWQRHSESHSFSSSCRCCCSARFDLVKKLKAHRHGVASLAFHPSGKFWLSVGQKDCTLKMYTSSTAKCAFDRKLDYKPMQLDFLSDGMLAILESSQIRIIDLDAGLTEPRRILQGGERGGDAASRAVNLAQVNRHNFN